MSDPLKLLDDLMNISKQFSKFQCNKCKEIEVLSNKWKSFSLNAHLNCPSCVEGRLVPINISNKKKKNGLVIKPSANTPRKGNEVLI
jgi:hypothetical protein